MNQHAINRDSDSTTPHLRDAFASGISRRRALSLAVKAAGGGALVLLAAACGDDGPGRYGVSAPTTEAPSTTTSPAAADGHPHDSGADDSTSAPPTTAAATGALVRSIDNSFNPEVLTVAAGTEVTWINGGRVDHDIVALDDSWGVEAEAFKPGVEFRHTFDEPGTYEYICTLHGSKKMVGMVGTIIVT